jgi:phospholipase C
VSERDDFQVPQGARSDQETKGVKERDDDGRHNRIHRIVAAPSQRRPRLWDSKGGSMRKLIGVLLVALALQIFAGPVRATHDDEREGRSSDERHSGQKALERIDHIVVIYQENWSFDSLFGLFPGADGIANAVNASGDLLFPQVSKRSCSPPLFRWTCVAHSQQPQSTQ